MKIKYFFIFISLCAHINLNLYGQNLLQDTIKESDKYLNLIHPRGTESFHSDEIINIEWDSKNIEKIKIEYLHEGNWDLIIENIKASIKKYKWKVDKEIKTSFKIRISDDSETTKIADTSPFFLRVIIPNNQLNTKYSAEITSSALLKIMPLGNSITHGYQIPLPAEFDGYRKPLKALLENNGLTFDFVGSKTEGTFSDNQHEGHGGWHSKHWYNNKKYSLADSLTKFLTLNPPDIILLHIGTNDIGEYFDSRNDNNIDSTVADISGLLDTIYNFDSSIRVILAKIINRIDDESTALINESDTTTAFNFALQNMANSRINNGDNLTIVDMENAIIYTDDLSDGLHPNSAGYDKIADVWFEGIIDLIPKLILKIFLEGAYSSSAMRKDLNTLEIIPTTQPFNTSPWSYDGTELVESIPDEIVDWVLVSLRTGTEKSSEVACRAAFLKFDGSIVDLDGNSPLTFVVDEGSYYVVVEHRNHLDVITKNKLPIFW